MFERWKAIFLIAGIGFFLLAFFSMGYLPWAHLSDLPMQEVAELAETPSPYFEDLAKRYPESFKEHFGEVSSETFGEALVMGRDSYIAEGCWHCHSQQIRPVGGETQRFGAVSYPEEYANKLQLPHLLGTRRVGPDLIRMSGKYANDWHAAHLYDPRIVVPTSVMPKYPWFFETNSKDEIVPNKRGLAMIAYLQWLGSWIPESERLK